MSAIRANELFDLAGDWINGQTISVDGGWFRRL
jgi:hypothetical protein